MNIPPLRIGDIVAPAISFVYLRSGAQQWDYAVVAGVDPFTLVSEDGDMRWRSTIHPDDFKKIGEAPRETLINVLSRMSRDNAADTKDLAKLRTLHQEIHELTRH